MLNVQHRVMNAPASRVADIVDELADPLRTVWPASRWPNLVLDRGLEPGSQGGHGPMRYSVVEYDPGRRVLLEFSPDSGLAGWHELRVINLGTAGSALVHTISARTHGRMLVLWPLLVRWFHEALMGDLFDNAERRAAGALHQPEARWSPWVKLTRSVFRVRR